MEEIVKSFEREKVEQKTLSLIKKKLGLHNGAML